MAKVGGSGAGGGRTPPSPSRGSGCYGGGGGYMLGAVRGTQGPKMFPGIRGIPGRAGQPPVERVATMGIMQPDITSQASGM